MYNISMQWLMLQWMVEFIYQHIKHELRLYLSNGTGSSTTENMTTLYIVNAVEYRWYAIWQLPRQQKYIQCTKLPLTQTDKLFITHHALFRHENTMKHILFNYTQPFTNNLTIYSFYAIYHINLSHDHFHFKVKMLILQLSH